MTDIIATSDDGKMRVILMQDTDCESPIEAGDTWVTSLTVEHGEEVLHDPKDRRNALLYFDDHVNGAERFIRYMRLFHGIEVREVSLSEGDYRMRTALAWIEPSELERVGFDDKVAPRAKADAAFVAEAIDIEVQEYNRWAEGDCWGYEVQRSITWVPVEDHDDDVSMTTWEHVDSCWGIIGREYAEQEARDALEAHRAAHVTVRKVADPEFPWRYDIDGPVRTGWERTDQCRSFEQALGTALVAAGLDQEEEGGW